MILEPSENPYLPSPILIIGIIAFPKSHDLILEMPLVETTQSSRNKTRICPPPEQEVVIFALKTKVNLAHKAKVAFH